MKTTSPDRVVVMPEVELEKVFLGGGGGGDLVGFSDPCLVKMSPAADLGAVFEGRSVAGLAGFSTTGFGSFSGPFLADVSGTGSVLGSSVTKITGDEVRC